MPRYEHKSEVKQALFSPAEAAKYLGVSRSHVYELMYTDALPSIYLGRARRIRLVDLENLVAEGTGE